MGERLRRMGVVLAVGGVAAIGGSMVTVVYNEFLVEPPVEREVSEYLPHPSREEMEDAREVLDEFAQDLKEASSVEGVMTEARLDDVRDAAEVFVESNHFTKEVEEATPDFPLYVSGGLLLFGMLAGTGGIVLSSKNQTN